MSSTRPKKKDQDDVQHLYNFVKEQVLAGLFKSDIITKLIEMGVDTITAAKLVEEMEYRLKKQAETKTILVVEDEPHSRELLNEILGLAGYAVRQADDGEAAVTAVREAIPDLIITDVLMPGMKGNEMIKALKAGVRGRDIPIIVLTARGRMKEYFDTLKVEEFLEKPFKAEDLLAKVKKHLNIDPRA